MSEVKLTDAELAALERISAAHRESDQGEADYRKRMEAYLEPVKD